MTELLVSQLEKMKSPDQEKTALLLMFVCLQPLYCMICRPEPTSHILNSESLPQESRNLPLGEY
jgi:hypothetical protein